MSLLENHVDWEEAFTYRPGQKVELKTQPGTFDTIASYEPMMVPPIWLVNDPKPRYAHELRVISHPVKEMSCLVATASLNKAAAVSAQSLKTLKNFLVHE